MKKHSILLILLSIFLISCNENRIFEEHTDPSGNLEWEDQVLEFDVMVEDVTLKYNVIVAFRYARGFMFTSVPVEIKRTSPNGVEEVSLHTIQARNRDGSYNGDGAGDIWDLEEMYQQGIQYPVKGTYHYEMRQLSDRQKMHMVMEVGLIVDKVVAKP